MPTLQLHRDHRLGLAKAREMAWQWAEAAEAKFEVACVVVESADHDVVEFKRAGVDGTLTVTATAFDLTVKLGLLLGAFGKRIEAEIDAKLDELLGQAEAKADSEAKAAKKAGAAPVAKGRKSKGA